jgi:allophanate hydrolase subunit 1
MASSSNSSANDRLTVIYDAYKAAAASRAADLRQATTADQVKRIMANVDALEAAYLDAANKSLDATGPDIEACFQAAIAAEAEVTRAYDEGKALAARIQAVSGVVTAVGNLVTTAAKLA